MHFSLGNEKLVQILIDNGADVNLRHTLQDNPKKGINDTKFVIKFNYYAFFAYSLKHG